MPELKYSYGLLKDTADLLEEMISLMGMNLVHPDSYCSDSGGKEKILQLIRYSLDNVNKLRIFK